MKLVILDRDGVINEDSDHYIKSPGEFIPIRRSLEAIARLNGAGYTIAVATNQSGIARGYFSEATLEAMHEKLHSALAEVGGRIDLLVHCPHGPDDHCACRKPRPGLLQTIGERLGVSLAGVPVIGDSLRDLEAARAVEAQPILVRTGKGERTLSRGEGVERVPVYRDLSAAVDGLLENETC